MLVSRESPTSPSPHGEFPSSTSSPNSRQLLKLPPLHLPSHQQIKRKVGGGGGIMLASVSVSSLVARDRHVRLHFIAEELSTVVFI